MTEFDIATKYGLLGDLSKPLMGHIHEASGDKLDKLIAVITRRRDVEPDDAWHKKLYGMVIDALEDAKRKKRNPGIEKI